MLLLEILSEYILYIECKRCSMIVFESIEWEITCLIWKSFEDVSSDKPFCITAEYMFRFSLGEEGN